MTVEGLLIFLLIGAIAGWLAGLIVRGFGFGLIGNIVVGIIGAFIAGLIFGGGNINSAPLDITSILVSLVGAIILLAIVNLIRRGTVR